MADHIEAYAGIRDRVTALTAPLDDAAAATLAPATPQWRVKDLVAHLTGVNADVVAGNVEGAGSDAWTEAQVAPRRSRPIEELLTEWHELAEPFQVVLPLVPDSPRSQIIFDAMTHEFDVRGALGVAGAREAPSVDIGFAWATDVVALIRDGAGTGALCLRTEYGDVVAGSGEVTATVAAERFELFRAMTGRRSPAQIAAFEWEGEVVTDHLAFLPARSTDLVE